MDSTHVCLNGTYVFLYSSYVSMNSSYVSMYYCHGFPIVRFYSLYIDFLVSAWAALMSACIAPIRSKSRSTAEPGRERRDEEVDLFDTLEERPDLVSILCFIIIQEFQSITNQTRSSNNSN